MQPADPCICKLCGSVIPPSDRELATPTLCTQCSTQVATRDAARQLSNGESPDQDKPAAPDPDDTIIAPVAGNIEPDETLAAGAAGSAVTQSITSSLLGTRLKIGRFEVVEILGHGSFGNVYRAYDPVLDREVALKVPRDAASEGGNFERFTREAKSAARLRHPNIVTVYESGSEGGVMYIASEFVQGVTLSHVIKTEAIDLRTSVDWVRQIAEALNYAHHEGVVHRDIKPSNIMINASRRPQVMDFGLAKRLADEVSVMTVEGQVLGTPAYMSPEQARGEMHHVGPLSDQYSVGVVLYELLCGQRMFAGPPWTVMSRIGNPHDHAAAPRSIRHDIPRDLEACCLKATEKECAARYPHLGALADDLARWLEGRPVLARPIGYRERFVRWTRKNPLITALASVLLLMLVAVTVASVVAAVQFKELASSEAASKRDLARLLIDTYAESGLAASDRNELAQAALWFSNASALATEHPSRREWNAIRRESWLSEVATPLRAFPVSGYFCKSVDYHPSARYLMVKSMAWECEIHDLTEGKLLPLPIAGQIDDAVWSPDGSLLAIASITEVVICRFPSNEILVRWNHPDPISALAFSPDGTLLAVGGATTFEIRLVEDGSIATSALASPGRITSAVFSPHAGFVAFGTEDQRVVVHALADGVASAEPVFEPMQASTELYEARFAFPDDGRLIVANSGSSIACWNLADGSMDWEHPTQRILDMSLSPDRSQVAFSEATANSVHRALILNSDDGAQTTFQVNHRNHILAVRWNPEGSLLLTAGYDHSVQISSVETGEPVLPAIPHCSGVLRAAWSPDRRTFATALRDDRLAQVWRMPEADEAAYEFATGTNRPFFKLWPAAAGGVVISTGFDQRRTDNVVRVRDAATGEQRGADIACRGLVSDAEWIDDRQMLTTAGSQSPEFDSENASQQNLTEPGIIQFWSIDDGMPLLPDVSTPSEPLGIAATGDGGRLGVICHSGEFLLIDCDTGTVVGQHAPEVAKVADYGFVIRNRIRCSPDDSRFATWGSGGDVAIWDAVTAELLFTVKHERSFLFDVRFSPDGEVFASCSDDGAVRVWDADSGDELAALPHAGWVFSAEFSADGEYLLTACEDRQARIWDWRDESIACTTAELSEQAYCVCFVTAEQFAVGTRDGMLTTWESETGKMLAPPRDLGNRIYQLAVDDGLLLVSGTLPSIFAFDLQNWIRKPDDRRSEEETRLIVELVAAQTIPETGTPTDLTAEEWLARWRQLQEMRPESELFRIPGNEPDFD